MRLWFGFHLQKYNLTEWAKTQWQPESKVTGFSIFQIVNVFFYYSIFQLRNPVSKNGSGMLVQKDPLQQPCEILAPL